MGDGLQSVAHEILEPTGFQPVVVQFLPQLLNIQSVTTKLMQNVRTLVVCLDLVDGR